MGKDLKITSQSEMSAEAPEMLMQVGRVVYITFGPCKGKLAVVVDIVDENRILVAGPTTGVDRQVLPSKRIALTKFRVKSVLRNQKESVLRKNIEAFGMEKRWNETAMAKKLAAQHARATCSDFDRFRAMVLRRQVATAVRGWVKKNRSKLNK